MIVLEGCGADEVSTLTALELFDPELTNQLYDIKNKSEFMRLKGLLQSRASKLGAGPDFKAFITQLEIDIDEYNDAADYDKQTNFGIDGWEHLNCGQWIADKKGIRKKGAKVFASLSPIQPVEILENVSSGTEKVKLQFFKNGRTRSTIVERNTIAAKSKIVNLASNGIEVTSESAGQLVQYLSEVINTNPLPFSTAYSQMGWHDDLFIPYDDEAVFDGEENNRYLFKAFTSRGSFKTWQRETAKYRENIIIRLAMAASFGSVLLERINALPFVFHIWGKSGTGKTVALMIAMSIWGNPRAGATVRTLNMTKNALIGQAAFLNSLPFAGDELQTIKEKYENYDKLIMRCTEGVDRGRMIDGQRSAEVKRWNCAFLFTGEDRCTRPNSGAGVKNRCVEAEVDSALFTESTGNEAVRIIEHNFGHAGRKFIEKVKKTDSDELSAEYNRITLDLAKRAGTEPKQAAALAVMMIADKIASELFWKDEKELNFDEIKPFITRSEDIDLAERAFTYIVDVIAMNRARFDSSDNNRGEVWGGYKNGLLYFNATVLRNELQKEGIELSSVSRRWAKKGYLVKNTEGRNSIAASVDGIKARYVALNLPEELEFDEERYGDIAI